MKVLSLDLSTSSGWAVLCSNLSEIELVDFGCYKALPSTRNYPYNFLERADGIAENLYSVYLKYLPDFIIIEDTNLGQQRFTQKFLEFIHATVLRSFFEIKKKVYYVSTSEWRSVLQLRLSKEEKSKNRSGNFSKVTLKHVAVQKVNSTFRLQLKQKDNDIADAILLGQAFLQGAKVSDGIMKKKVKQ